MTRRNYLAFILILGLAHFQAVQAFDWGGELIDVFTESLGSKYPEEENKVIHVTKGSSPLNETRQSKPEPPAVPETIEELGEDVFALVNKGIFNKFTMGTGAVDVTFQVRDGVKYALEDTFSGYAEFQRRKVLEEILNSNAKANARTTEFLLLSTGLKEESHGLLDFEAFNNIFEDFFAFPDFTIFSNKPNWQDSRNHNMLQISKNIISTTLIKDLNKLIAGAAASILVLFCAGSIITRIAHSNRGLAYSVSEPLIQKLGALVLICSSYLLLDLCLDAGYFINNGLAQMISDNGFDLSNTLDLNVINQSWEELANGTGYFPAMMLGVINMLAQIFVYIYVAGLLLQIILGFVISPIWALAYSTDSLKAASIGAFLVWLKALLTLNFIPVIYLVFSLINLELNDLNLDILNIAFAIASLVLLPMVSKLLLGENGGFVRSGFWGYEMMLQSIESGYSQVCRLLEEQYRLGLESKALVRESVVLQIEPRTSNEKMQAITLTG